MTVRSPVRYFGVSLIVVMAVAAGAFGKTAQVRPSLVDWQVWTPGVNMYHYLGPIDLRAYGSIPTQSWYFRYGSPSYSSPWYGGSWPRYWPYGYPYSPYYYQYSPYYDRAPYYGPYYYPHRYYSTPYPYYHYRYHPIHPYRGHGWGMERHGFREHRGSNAPQVRAAPRGHR